MCRRRCEEPRLGDAEVTRRVAAVDIGTNSMRLLIVGGDSEIGRWERVTGLGRGVDHTGKLSEQSIAMTLPVLKEYGRLMDLHQVTMRRAIATSASRDASNREEFFDLVESALGVRPTLISGEEEARLAFAGVVGSFDGPGPVVVSDIGGGSTEFVTATGGVSVDIGSVRITERVLPDRPAAPGQIAAARELIRNLFSVVDVGEVGSLVGVAGTWTELPALARNLPSTTGNSRVHGHPR
jgi:exopolyphosphatase / guanosine-5'-triphosphate,3'-diphosphate pyrophosphatase